jgi:hypothetical protein
MKKIPTTGALQRVPTEAAVVRDAAKAVEEG